ncbi:MAG TPA: hypothetical protein PK177_21595 [Burkholderiaceae bacterium]|nr:hypothetical protein [Burkholderiaceae bacterium]
MSPARIHPSVRPQVIEWLEDAAVEAADSEIYRNPHLAAAFYALADSVRLEATTTRGEQPQFPRNA